MTTGVVFLLEVDNTLLDSDHFIADVQRHLALALGTESAQRYWSMLEMLRDETGYVDYLGAFQRVAREPGRASATEAQLLSATTFLIDYPFAQRLYPRALDVIRHLSRFGQPVILTDGDAVFQRRKVPRSGLWDAVGGRVLIGPHKAQMLDIVERRYPARQYVMVDDKLRNLMAMKSVWREPLTTIFPRQGHYALDPDQVVGCMPADFTIDSIGELADVDLSPLTEAAAAGVETVREAA